jgi:hypothetical protein
MTDIIKKKGGKNQKKIHETSGAMGRKGGKVSVQPKDQTGCEDTHEPVRGGWHC